MHELEAEAESESVALPTFFSSSVCGILTEVSCGSRLAIVGERSGKQGQRSVHIERCFLVDGWAGTASGEQVASHSLLGILVLPMLDSFLAICESVLVDGTREKIPL